MKFNGQLTMCSFSMPMASLPVAARIWPIEFQNQQVKNQLGVSIFIHCKWFIHYDLESWIYTQRYSLLHMNQCNGLQGETNILSIAFDIDNC